MAKCQINCDNQQFDYDIAQIKLDVPGIKTPVAFRPDTTDVSVFSQIFIGKSYQLTTNFSVQSIIDGGANVGYASVWFANQFPDAEIVAVEPEGENVAILRENTSYYPSIRIVQAALWDKPGELNLVTCDDNNAPLGHWGVRVQEPADVAKGVKAITIDEILSTTGWKTIDILKLDIEGAEKEVFRSNFTNWLSKTNILILELHDRFRAGCSEAVYSAVRRFDFKEYHRGENNFFVRTPPLVE